MTYDPKTHMLVRRDDFNQLTRWLDDDQRTDPLYRAADLLVVNAIEDSSLASDANGGAVEALRSPSAAISGDGAWSPCAPTVSTPRGYH